MSYTYPYILRPYLRATVAQKKPAESLIVESTPKEESTEKNSVRSSWLVNAPFDLLFVCGFAPWILGYIVYSVIGISLVSPIPGQSQHAFATLFVFVSLLVGESHQYTSIVRYFVLRERHKNDPKPDKPVSLWKLVWLVSLGFLALMVVWSGLMNLSLVSQVLVPLMTVVFPLVLMQHVCAQAKSIGLIYCGKESYVFSKDEQFHLSLLTWMLVFTGVLSIAFPLGFTSQISNTIFIFGQWVWGFTALAIIAFSLMLIRKGFIQGKWLPMGATILWSNLAIFVLAGGLSPMVYVWMFVPVLFHATQHWAVAWSTAQKEAAPRSGIREVLSFICRVVLPVQACMFFFLHIPTFFSDPFQGAQLTLPLSWSMLVFYLHYFTDRKVWRPRKKIQGENHVFKAA